jgi:tetratricopeptide (TPR) repeat protein
MKATFTECPDPEVLAAYLAGRLPETERRAVTEHLADCADCYAVFIATAREYRGWRWAWAERIWRAVVEASGWSKAVVVTAALGTATASLTFFLRPELMTQWWPGRSELTELVAAVGTERTIEPRLTGGFAYGPLRGPVRGERTDERLSPELRIAALTLEKRLQGRRDPSSLAAYAAALLVTGQADQAVSALEEAARLAPKNARVQNDLSAAYLVRAREKADPEDLNKALTAAAAATDADPSLAEAQFNVALALEGLSRRNEARTAWEVYLKTDSKSAWAQEARRHLELLAPEKQSELQDDQRLPAA